MPRGRGGRGRAGRGVTTPRGSKFSRSAPQLLRKSTRSISNLSETNPQADGVYATWDRPVLIIRGLTDEDFDRWGPEDEDENPSFVNDDPLLSPAALLSGDDPSDGFLREEPVDAASEYEEVWISPPRRGFYIPPPVKVWRRKEKDSLANGEAEDQPGNGGSSQSNHRDSGDEDKEPSDSGDLEETQPTDDVEMEEVTGENLSQEPCEADEVENDAASVVSEKEDEPPDMIDEADLSDSNYPPPFLDRPPTPDEADCDDPADFIVRTRFAPMSDPQLFVKALTKYPAASRDTKVLYQLALNTQRALKEWQDQYLMLDARTAHHANPPKKPVTGGRIPIQPEVFEDIKEADLYGYVYDAKKQPGHQDPFRQRPGGGETVGGRELRQRRARELGEEPSDDEGTGTEVGKRKRKAVVRYDGEPRAMRGRKRTIDSEPPEIEAPPRKRGRPSAADKAAQMHQSIRRLREESTVASTISESESMSPGPPRRRGRPPGSKNLQPRSDAGIKKGPRKARIIASVTPEVMQIDEPSRPASTVQAAARVSGTVEDPFIENKHLSKIQREERTPSSETSTTMTDGPPPAPVHKRKQRVKSEKRSQSMTEWWAARKARQLEERKKAQAEEERKRVAAEQQAERNNYNNRFRMNESNAPSPKTARSAASVIAPAPSTTAQASPTPSQFIISGPQHITGHVRKHSSPLKEVQVRPPSRDVQDVPSQIAVPQFSPPPPHPRYPLPPMPIQPAQNHPLKPFRHQLHHIPAYQHPSMSGPTPPPPLTMPPNPAYPHPNPQSFIPQTQHPTFAAPPFGSHSGPPPPPPPRQVAGSTSHNLGSHGPSTGPPPPGASSFDPRYPHLQAPPLSVPGHSISGPPPAPPSFQLVPHVPPQPTSAGSPSPDPRTLNTRPPLPPASGHPPGSGSFKREPPPPLLAGPPFPPPPPPQTRPFDVSSPPGSQFQHLHQAHHIIRQSSPPSATASTSPAPNWMPPTKDWLPTRDTTEAGRDPGPGVSTPTLREREHGTSAMWRIIPPENQRG